MKKTMPLAFVAMLSSGALQQISHLLVSVVGLEKNKSAQIENMLMLTLLGMVLKEREWEHLPKEIAHTATKAVDILLEIDSASPYSGVLQKIKIASERNDVKVLEKTLEDLIDLVAKAKGRDGIEAVSDYQQLQQQILSAVEAYEAIRKTFVRTATAITQPA